MKASGSPHLSRSVGPAFSQSSASPKSAATIARAAQEGPRQRFGEAQFAILGYREKIYVSGRASDEAEGGQRGTPDYHELNVAT
jgi:hypothetical protein